MNNIKRLNTMLFNLNGFFRVGDDCVSYDYGEVLVQDCTRMYRVRLLLLSVYGWVEKPIYIIIYQGLIKKKVYLSEISVAFNTGI